MRRLRWMLIAALLPLCTVCAPPETGPHPSPERINRLLRENVSLLDTNTILLRFAPPAHYALWRFQVELCSGLQRTGWPSFWVAPVLVLNRSGAVGMYIARHQRIVFGIGYETVDWVVRHELLHFLVGAPGHPDKYFKGQCAPLVYPVVSP